MRHLGVCLLSTSPLSSAVKRQFQLQVAEVFPLFSSAPKMEALSEELTHTPLSTEQDSSDMLLSVEDSSAITRQFLKLWSWYKVSLLKLVIGIQLGSKALEGLEHFVKTRDDCLQYTSLPDCFPQGPLTVDQLAPPPGYAPCSSISLTALRASYWATSGPSKSSSALPSPCSPTPCC